MCRNTQQLIDFHKPLLFIPALFRQTSSSINFCKQIFHRLVDDGQKVAVGEQDDTIFINKHISALRHAEKAEGIVGFGGRFLCVAQEGERELIALSKAFVGGLTVGTDAEHHDVAFSEFEHVVPVVAQLRGTDRGVVAGIENDEYFFSGKVGERNLLSF